MPGRSGRRGGSGLGLAISQLLARQSGATRELAATGLAETIYRLILPLTAALAASGVASAGRDRR